MDLGNTPKHKASEKIMTTYNFTEVQNINSSRESETFEAKDLTAAKRLANKMQFFQGTVLKISDSLGNLICFKDGKNWTNA